MSRKIFRYPLELKEAQEILIPGCLKEDSDIIEISVRDQVIKVDTIRGIPSIWCILDEGRPLRRLKLNLYGTGLEAPKAKPENYLGSFMIMDSEIYHIFIDGWLNENI